MIKSLCRYMLALFLCIYSYLSLAHPGHKHRPLQFQNFSDTITLTKSDGGYVDENTGQRFELTNRLIVKAEKSLSIDQLQKAHRLVESVTPIYVGADFDYYRVDIKRPKAVKALIFRLARLDGILLVQPDLLQLGPRAIGGTEANKTQTKVAVEGMVNNKAKTTKLKAREKRTSANILSEYYQSTLISALMKKGRGDGIKVAVIDDGFDLSHPALQHKKPAFSYDAHSQQLDASGGDGADKDSEFDDFFDANKTGLHGTRIAGILFADEKERIAGGIVSDADFIALRHLDTWTSSSLLMFHLAQLEGADVINCSWTSPFLVQPIADIVQDLSLNGRGGKGIAVVFAAGNQGQDIAKVSPTEASMTWPIVVGAHQSDFKRLNSSNYGASVDVLSLGESVMTTSVSGRNSSLGSTSLAAVITTGVVALLLEQNPDLTLSQIHDMLPKYLSPK